MAEQKQTTSLMKKTKSQLIDIILRKDNVEVELQNKLKEANGKINDIELALDNAKSDYEVIHHSRDSITKENAELQNKLDEKEIEIHDLNIKYQDALTQLSNTKVKLGKANIAYEKTMNTAVKLLWSTVGMTVAFIISIIAHFVR